MGNLRGIFMVINLCIVLTQFYLTIFRGIIMKKLFFVLVVLTFSFPLTNAQASKDGWAVGFGLVSPRLFSDVDAENFDFGGQLLVQKNLSEQVGLRLSLDYLNFTAKPSKFTNSTVKFGVGAIYNLFPCQAVCPYVGIGGSILYYSLNDPDKGIKNKSTFGELTTDVFFGSLFNISQEWFVKAEFGAYSISTDKFDGTVAAGGGGLFGGSLDSYTSVELGLLYYFDKGTKSTFCDEPASGLSAKVDYAKIEEYVRKYASTPTNVDYNKIEDLIKKNCGATTIITEKVLPSPTPEKAIPIGKWILTGVNFVTASASLTINSSQQLDEAAQTLLANPDVKVEIQGHTDNVGSKSSNKKLSKQRAETVKRFLIAKGVAASRLSTVGFGSTNPVSDNKTVEGRSLNRRIEFKVLDK